MPPPLGPGGILFSRYDFIRPKSKRPFSNHMLVCLTNPDRLSVPRGFRPFPRKLVEGTAWNLACWRVLTTFGSNYILVTLCWFSKFFGAILLSETGHIWGFWAFPGERMEGISWNLACWCVLTTFTTNKIMVKVCWFSQFWPKDMGQFWDLGISRRTYEREWPKMWHADVSLSPTELIKFWSWSVDFPPFWHHFDLVKHIISGLSRHFLENAWE